MKKSFLLLSLAGVGAALLYVQRTFAAESFANFETAPIHPIALSPDGTLLAVCNLPDCRVEFFDLASGLPSPSGSMPVGVDPVAVRFRSDEELWVVNHISDSITILSAKTRNVLRTLQTLDSPADVVFAGNPQRAFVSCAFPNTVQVFDPVTFSLVQNIQIAGDRPKALAVSPDGEAVYAAIFESGNGSTILSPGSAHLDRAQGFFGISDSTSPYAGANPPPILSNIFSPSITSNLPTPPRVNLIVKKNAQARWLDDNGKEWTEFVSGRNAHRTGRIKGWDLRDLDLAVIDVSSLTISYASGLMNLCMSLAVNPASGQIAVVGTDALNEVRYEPALQSIFARVNLAFVEPNLFTTRVHDLNPHLDYAARTIRLSERRKSISDPRGIVFNAAGTCIYVTGMGSDNLLVLDQNGSRVASPVPLPEGATGMALDEARDRLYVFCRFANSLAVVSTLSNVVLATIPLFDPTPERIRLGRRHFYNSHHTSGLGQASCASCHPDARMDRLAWDLGNPLGQLIPFGTNLNFPGFNLGVPSPEKAFHPMKGPMVTQTLQDIIGQEPFHWRGDRKNIEEFNPTFKDLQGRDEELAQDEMRELKEFLASIRMPPNPYRTLSNTLPATLTLTGHLSPPGSAQPGSPLPPADPMRALKTFQSQDFTCHNCHSLPTGLGPGAAFSNVERRWIPVPLGPNGENHVGLVAINRNNLQHFKNVQFRNIHERIGFDRTSTNSTSGFGFLHDGSVDTLPRFLAEFGDSMTIPAVADLMGFLFSFGGADFPAPPTNLFSQSPNFYGNDVPSGFGRQITITNTAPDPLLDAMLRLANNRTNRLELICTGQQDSTPRGWVYDPARALFQSDRASETVFFEQLRNLARPDQPLTFTLVLAGTGTRIAVDRDDDRYFNRDEVTAESNPADPLSVPGKALRIQRIVQANSQIEIHWLGLPGKSYHVLFTDRLPAAAWTVLPGDTHSESGLLVKSDPIPPTGHTRYYRVESLP